MWGREQNAVHLSMGENYSSLMCEKLLCRSTKPRRAPSPSLISACSVASNFHSRRRVFPRRREKKFTLSDGRTSYFSLSLSAIKRGMWNAGQESNFGSARLDFRLREEFKTQLNESNTCMYVTVQKVNFM